MTTFKDQCGRLINIPQAPQRIVSLVPSQTELLYHLGLGSKVVGVTAYCVHPAEALQQKTIIGGTKNLQLDTIRNLKPDLIIGNKEENNKVDIDQLAKEFPVWISDIDTLDQATDMIERIGNLCQAQKAAESLVHKIKSLANQYPAKERTTALYFIWKKPYMVCGQNTFINSMMEQCGFTNVAPTKDERYPTLNFDEIAEIQPQTILLSSEPYSFTTSDLHHFGDKFPNCTIKIVDGELFSWYGNRMVNALEYFSKIKPS